MWTSRRIGQLTIVARFYEESGSEPKRVWNPREFDLSASWPKQTEPKTRIMFVAGPEGIEPSTFGCPSAVKSFSLAPARPLLYLSRADQLA